jgi:hypothetical protein
MLYCTMCHGFKSRDWSYETEEESEELTEEPSPLDDEPAEDVEILTDGGNDAD